MGRFDPGFFEMKCGTPNRFLFVFWALVFCCPLAHSQTLTGVQWPIPFDQTNMVPGQTARFRALLTGKELRPLANGLFFVIGVRIESYQIDGATNLIARAADCIFNPETKVATSTNRLELESPNGLTIDGIGFRCHLTDVNLIISNSVHTSIEQRMLRGARDLPGGASVTNLPGTTNIAMTVDADRFELDHPGNLITYLGHVQLEHTQMRLQSEVLRAWRSTNGALERVVAERHVGILNKIDGSRASGDLAIYTTAPNEVLQLSGHAHWQDEQRRSSADYFLYEPKTRHLRAEGKASMTLPRQMIGHPDLWDAHRGTNEAKVFSAIPTNAPVEISAEVLDLQMPNTNQPARFMVAERNVVIVSSADMSRATADRAVFDERTGLMELRGDAFWRAGDRIAGGEVLQYDRTNRVFSAHTNAYLKVAVNDLRNRTAAGRSLSRTNSSFPMPDFIEVSAHDYTYTSNLFVFTKDVRGNFLEGNINRATLTCGFLGLRLNNQLQSVYAADRVRMEQFPFARASAKIARQAECEQLHIRMSPEGTIENMAALTNVVSLQQEWRTNSAVPIRSHFGADVVTADFFARSNEIRQAIADGHVRLSQDQPQPRGGSGVLTNYFVGGERAVFTATNNLAELTGHPFAYSARGAITNADVLLWNRKENVFMGRQVRGQGDVQLANTNVPKVVSTNLATATHTNLARPANTNAPKAFDPFPRTRRKPF